MAEEDGGGVLVNQGGELTVKHSTITRNIAEDNGGGIANNGTTRVKGSTFTLNRAQEGGGIQSNGHLSVTETEINLNAAGISVAALT